MKKIMLTFVLAIAAGVWNWNWASDSQISSLPDEWNVMKYSEPAFVSQDTVTPYYEWYYRTRHYYLKDDTTINSTHYTKAFYENVYIGALRENDDASKVFGIPVNQTHEYLLYDWSAQVGDTLQNFWVGEDLPQYLDILYVKVNTIYNWMNPREIFINVVGYLKGSDDSTHYAYTYKVLEGVGMSYGSPIIHSYIEEGDQQLLCAYKNGEQIYTSAQGKRIGCYFENKLVTGALSGSWKLYKETLSTSSSNVTRDVNNDSLYIFTDSTLLITCPTCDFTPSAYGITPPGLGFEATDVIALYVKDLYGILFEKDSHTPYSCIKIHKMTRNEIEWSFYDINTEHKYLNHYQYLRRYPKEFTDTIPLFIKDGPGSSTVEPVDPNLIYATLTKDILAIYEKMDMEIGFTLYKTPSANQTPAVKRMIKATTFNDSVSTTITESGTYTIELTNPTWDYTIIGTFEYQVPQAVENTVANTPAATKILRDGQLILMYEGKIYNVQGQQIQ